MPASGLNPSGPWPDSEGRAAPLIMAWLPVSAAIEAAGPGMRFMEMIPTHALNRSGTAFPLRRGSARSQQDRFKACDIVQRLGLNAYDCCFGGAMTFPSPPGHPIQPGVPAATGSGWYIKKLYDMGIIGPGKKIDTYPLRWISTKKWNSPKPSA